MSQGTKSSNVILIVIGVFGVLGVLLLGTCVGGLYFAKTKAMEALEGGAIVLSAPQEVISALAGDKKDYVGTWRSAGGSLLVIDAAGNLVFEQRDGRSNQNLRVPIAAFVGNDIQAKAFVTITIRVSAPPRRDGSAWVMTADGITFTRD